MIEALNFLTQNGYSFVQAYTFSSEDKNVLHYLLRKTEINKEQTEYPHAN